MATTSRPSITQAPTRHPMARNASATCSIMADLGMVAGAHLSIE